MLADPAAVAASLLHEARRLGRRRAALPADCRPRAVADAYRIQDRLVELLGMRTAGWKVRSTSAVAQLFGGLGLPFAARLLESALTAASAEPVHELVLDGEAPATIEAEIGFRLRHNLAPARAPYPAKAILDSVGTLHPVLEVYESPFDRWVDAGLAGVIAENGIDSRLVVGEGIPVSRCGELGKLWIAVHVNGEPLAAGPGNHVLGAPVALLCWLVNGLLRHREGLRAGELVGAGSFTGILAVRAGDALHADFGSLGEISLTTRDASRG